VADAAFGPRRRRTNQSSRPANQRSPTRRAHSSKIRHSIPVAPPWRGRLMSRRCNIWRLSFLKRGAEYSRDLRLPSRPQRCTSQTNCEYAPACPCLLPGAKDQVDSARQDAPCFCCSKGRTVVTAGQERTNSPGPANDTADLPVPDYIHSYPSRHTRHR
jgi:hypothetical protein